MTISKGVLTLIYLLKKHLKKYQSSNEKFNCIKLVGLIDDVYTTGATLHLAAKALTEMGVEEVESLTLFR